MSHETLQNGLGLEWRTKIAAQDLRGAKAVKGLMKHAARLHARGLVTFEELTSPALEPTPSITVILKDNPVDHLAKVTAEYRKDPYNPERVTAFQQAFWQVPRGERNYTFKVDGCDWTKENMARPLKGVERVARGFKEVEHRGVMVALPNEFQGREGLVLLGRMWPELGSRSVQEDTTLTNGNDTTGYLKIEASIQSPNRDMREQDYAHLITPTIHGQRVITYVAGSEQSKLLTGFYFDQDNERGENWTSSRLPGSRYGSFVVDADFNPDGSLYVYSNLYSDNHYPYLGVRLEEVNKA